MSPCCTLLSRPLAHRAVFDVAKALFAPIGNTHHSVCRCLILCSIITILGCARTSAPVMLCRADSARKPGTTYRAAPRAAGAAMVAEEVRRAGAAAGANENAAAPHTAPSESAEMRNMSACKSLHEPRQGSTFIFVTLANSRRARRAISGCHSPCVDGVASDCRRRGLPGRSARGAGVPSELRRLFAVSSWYDR